MPDRYVVRKQFGGAYGVYDRLGLTNEPNNADNLVSGHKTQDEAEAAARQYATTRRRRKKRA